MLNKIIEKFAEWSSYTEILPDGTEVKRPWTLRDLLVEQFFIWVGVVIGVLIQKFIGII